MNPAVTEQTRSQLNSNPLKSNHIEPDRLESNRLRTDWNKKIELDLKRLNQESGAFFKKYGTRKLLGNAIFNCLDSEGKDTGKISFYQLLEMCGYAKNADEFFKTIIDQINTLPKKKIVLNGIQIPQYYVYFILNILFPGEKLHSIKTTDQLSLKTKVETKDDTILQQVIHQFPVRLSDHVIRQSLVSDGVALQYIPDENELDPAGHDITFDGHFKKGLLEQMYQNRVVFLLDMQCPVYCRFCFRKHKSNRKEKTPSVDDVRTAVKHVAAHPSVKEILITGGEPLFNRHNFNAAVTGLIKIDHVQTIRVATRSIAYYPHLFLKKEQSLLTDLIQKNKLCRKRGKAIEIGIHMVHPDEISIACLEIISELVKNGIRVYVQTPFLNGLNTKGKTLANLFISLRQAGAQIYYIFAPCSPIHGTRSYWAPICDTLNAAEYLRKSLSDRCVPKICTATPLGKIEWHTSGWAVEKDQTDPGYTWIRTPYSKTYFEQFLHHSESGEKQDSPHLPDYRINDEGTLDARFKVDMGDAQLLMGNRPGPLHNGLVKNKPSIEQKNRLKKAAVKVLAKTPLFRTSVYPVPSKQISRFHKACVEITLNADTMDLNYIQNQTDVTDVVINYRFSEKQAFEKLARLVAQLKTMDHIICVRISIPELILHPDKLKDDSISQLISWSDFSAADPFRIEIETWALVSGLDSYIGTITQKLVSQGVNVYANVPLFPGLNNIPQMLVELAWELRKNQIEFHHIYVSGLEIQTRLEQQFNIPAIDTQTMIDIAAKVRTDCSGREIPLYIVQTSDGEKDYTIFTSIP